MDFGALLHYAKKKNDAATKDEHGKYYSTKYAPPKKESKESKQLSNNIQKFLQKREAEESEKKRQEREKLNNLLALRDEKSKNKIRKMLKVTKSANKSVLEDAKDCDNALDGPDQPDGDDYGYVSTEANAFYQKYIEKVKDVHEDKGFAPSRPQSLSDLSGTKERVKAAITREREEARSHTRGQRISNVPSTTRNPKEPSVARSYTSSKPLYNPEAERKQQEEEAALKKPKVKRPAQPPPMDFQALLRLAEKKQHEPVNIAAPEKKKEPERLLSAREKKEQEERQRWKEQRAQRERQRETEAKSKEGRKEGGGSASQQQPQRMEPNGRIPKLNKAAINGKVTPAPPLETKAKSTSDSLKRPATGSGSGSGSSAKISATSKSSSNGQNKRPVSQVPTTKSSSSTSSSSSSAAKPAPKLESRNPYASVNKTGATREFPPRDPAAKTRAFPPQDVQRSMVRKPQPPPSSDARGRGNSSMNNNRKQVEMSNKRRIYDDDDSEYDSELDDFIDDGDCEEDISSHIRDIFGYDKRRYRDLDEDDAQMESSFAQMQREELISKKLGIQEDLEDMRMEALHKKNKMAKKRTRRIDDDD